MYKQTNRPHEGQLDDCHLTKSSPTLCSSRFIALYTRIFIKYSSLKKYVPMYKIVFLLLLYFHFAHVLMIRQVYESYLYFFSFLIFSTLESG